MKTKDLGDISRAFAATARAAGSSTDTDAIRRLMDRLRSADEHECEVAIGHLLEQADVGVFERAADEIDRLRGALERILAEHQQIVGDTRSYCLICAPGDGSWPCVTVLEARAALGVGE